MTIHINEILKEYDKLQDSSYVSRIRSTGVRKYDYKSSQYVNPTDLSFSRNRALILAFVMLKRTEVEKLIGSIYDGVVSSFIAYTKDNQLVPKGTKYLGYDNIKDRLNYSLITGITKDMTKKSLSMFKPQIVDKLFEANGIQKRTIAKKGNKPLVIDQLNTFTLVMFKEAFQPNSLALTELKRIFNDTARPLSLEWSNAVFNTIKPSKAAYRYIYDATSNADAEIFKHIVVVGEKLFNTPVGNHKRYCETEKTVVTSTMDLPDVYHYELTKAALEAPIDSPIYNNIIDNLQGTKSDLLTYITNLTAIADKLDY